MLAWILSCPGQGRNSFLPHCLSLHCMLFNSVIVYVFVCVCSSENTDGGRGQTHKEVMNTVAEMKKRLPSDKRSRSKASTVEALHYALNCVKQVQGNLSGENKWSNMNVLSLFFFLHIIFNAACVCSSSANSEYYNLLMRNGQDERKDASVCTLEELERVTSEHTLKNTVYILACTPKHSNNCNCKYT